MELGLHFRKISLKHSDIENNTLREKLLLLLETRKRLL